MQQAGDIRTQSCVLIPIMDSGPDFPYQLRFCYNKSKKVKTQSTVQSPVYAIHFFMQTYSYIKTESQTILYILKTVDFSVRCSYQAHAYGPTCQSHNALHRCIELGVFRAGMLGHFCSCNIAYVSYLKVYFNSLASTCKVIDMWHL